MRKISALITIALASPAAAQDVIRMSDANQSRKRGEIISMNLKTVEIEIEIEAGGLRVPQKVSARDIHSIEIDRLRRPFDFSSGEDAMAKGEYAQAVERFERARKDSRDVVRQTAAINIVRCHYNNNDFQACLAAIKQLRQEKPDSFYLRETYEYEYRCYQALNDASGLARTVEEFEKRGKAEKLDDWAKSAEMMRAELLEFQGKWSEALAIHSRLARDKDVAEEAILGELRCLRELKNWVQLKSKAEVALGAYKGKKGYDRLLTGAYNARGEASLQAGNAKDALLDFMQGVDVYNKGGESSREHERALALAGLACAQIASAEKVKARKDLYKERAAEMLGELKKAYPDSRLQTEVAKAVQDIK